MTNTSPGEATLIRQGLHYEAAPVLLTRHLVDSDLRTWELKLRERLGSSCEAHRVAAYVDPEDDRAQGKRQISLLEEFAVCAAIRRELKARSGLAAVDPISDVHR